MKRFDTSPIASHLVRFEQWRQQIGISSPTAWRWRNAGIVRVIEIRGRLFVSRHEIRRFEQRAAAGEFSISSRAAQNTSTAGEKEPTPTKVS